jgi:hypothetical protein
MSNESPAALAEARIAKKELKAREGELALKEYYAQTAETEAKTARLRAERLAKEAADREAARTASPEPVAKPRAVKRKA